MENHSEPRLDPPEDYYITADCGHEVYAGENVFEWERCDPITKKRRTILICPDCFDDYFAAFTREEKAALLGLSYSEVKPCRRFTA